MVLDPSSSRAVWCLSWTAASSPSLSSTRCPQDYLTVLYSIKHSPTPSAIQLRAPEDTPSLECKQPNLHLTWRFFNHGPLWPQRLDFAQQPELVAIRATTTTTIQVARLRIAQQLTRHIFLASSPIIATLSQQLLSTTPPCPGWHCRRTRRPSTDGGTHSIM